MLRPLLVLLVLTSCAARPPLPFDLAPPGTAPELFAPGVVSTEGSIELNGVLSPDGRELFFTRVAEDGCAGAVACDDEHLDALVDQVVHDIQREAADLGDRTRAIGATSGVADVEERLVGQQVEHGPRHRQTTDPAVEDPNRCVGHGARVTASASTSREVATLGPCWRPAANRSP